MILPADHYIVVNKSIITELDKKILVDLYQPIIGSTAISLYLALLNELEKTYIITAQHTHHHLFSIMQTSSEDLEKTRQKLEGIGLMKTYLRKLDNNTNYVYVLYSPLSANEFLNHPILNIVLYNNLGKAEYKKIVDSYKIPKVSLKDYEDISLSFDEVYSSVDIENAFTNEDIISKNKGNIFFKNAFDFDMLIDSLDINTKMLTKDTKYLINCLSYLYNIDFTTMIDLIRSSLNEKGSIDKEYLRKSVRNYYEFEHSGNLPTIIHNTQPEHLKTKTEGISQKDKMIYTFENTNPYNFLKSKYKDGKIVTRDLHLLESLLLDLKLTPGVVNVLLDYVLRVNNMKLNKTYIETIASHWKRLGIETVPEAMDACIKEYKKPNKKTNINSKKEEKVPQWFDKQIDKKENKQDEEELKKLISDYK